MPDQDKSLGIPQQIFEKFLKELSAAEMPAELVERLRKTLLEEQGFTERVLREALLNEGPPS